MPYQTQFSPLLLQNNATKPIEKGLALAHAMKTDPQYDRIK